MGETAPVMLAAAAVRFTMALTARSVRLLLCWARNTGASPRRESSDRLTISGRRLTHKRALADGRKLYSLPSKQLPSKQHAVAFDSAARLSRPTSTLLTILLAKTAPPSADTDRLRAKCSECARHFNSMALRT